MLTEQLEQQLPSTRPRWRSSAASPPVSRPGPARCGRAAAWALAASVAAVLIVGGALLLSWLAPASHRQALAAEAVNDHLRVLARTLDVESGEIHQVRPWFAGRLDFAPVIAFGGDAEFPLRGGTVEYFRGPAGGGDRLRTAPAHRHAARLPRRRAAVAGPDGAVVTRERGFNVRLWRANGCGYALVSDLDAAELARLAARLGG